MQLIYFSKYNRQITNVSNSSSHEIIGLFSFCLLYTPYKEKDKKCRWKIEKTIYYGKLIHFHPMHLSKIAKLLLSLTVTVQFLKAALSQSDSVKGIKFC